jgi:phosphatidylinositol alpha-1,6-mannosyltransferase
MSILIVTQTFPPRMGGMEAVMLSLANHFSNVGYETLVVADKPYNSPSTFKHRSFNAPRFLRPWLKKCYLNLSALSPDFTLCDSWKSVSAVPKNHGKLIVLAHGQELLFKSERKKTKICKSLSRADLVVASSNMTAKLAKELTTKPVITVYPTYMLAESHKTPSRKVHTNLLSLCRLDRRKGLIESAHALANLRDKGIEFHWNIAGSGPIENELRGLVFELKLSDKVTFHGRVDDQTKESLLNKASLFLMPSYQLGRSLEGFGISYIEAAKAGLPSIAGNIGGAPEAVLDGHTGWCVDGSSISAIQHALAAALNSSELVEKLGENAKCRFDKELSAPKVFKQLLQSMSDL